MIAFFVTLFFYELLRTIYFKNSLLRESVVRKNLKFFAIHLSSGFLFARLINAPW